MGLLDQLIGGGEPERDYRDFVDRYDQGAPYDGISDEEAAGRYGQVAGEVDRDTYRQSARDALANMGDDERADYARQLGAVAGEREVDHGWDGRSTDPDTLAETTTRVHEQDPGLLGSLLGGGGGGGNPVMKAALGGIAAMAAKRFLGGGTGSGGLGGLLGGR